MSTLRAIIAGVLDRPVRLKVTVTKELPTLRVSSPMAVGARTKKTPRHKPEKQFISTPGGLMSCTVPDFDPSTYKGLKKNCGKPSIKKA